MKLALNQIRRDGGTQSRAQIDWAAIDEYASYMKLGDEFEPVVVYYDGSACWLADGFHRVGAAEKAGLAEISANVRQGTRRDAVLHSVGANARHGVRRTNGDKRKAVTMLLMDEEWKKWNNHDIALACAVSFHFVRKVRDELRSAGHEMPTHVKSMRNGKIVMVPSINAKRELIVDDNQTDRSDNHFRNEIIEISFHDTEFTYRIAPDDPCLIERCPNQDGARWYWYLRRDIALETYEAFLVLSNSMELPIEDDNLETTDDELVYDDYDADDYDADDMID